MRSTGVHWEAAAAAIGRMHASVRHGYPFLCTLFFALVAPVLLYQRGAHAELTHSIQHYTAEDGLAGAVVRAVERTDDGVMWFGCWGRGLSAYDGMTWRNFGLESGLPNLDVRAVRLDAFGRLWVGTADGVVCRVGERWEPMVADVPGGAALSVFTAVLVPGGSLWFGLADGRVVSFTQEEDSSLAERPSGKWAVVLDVPTSGSVYAVEAICPTRDGDVLVGTDQHGIIRYREGVWSQAPGDDTVLGADAIVETPDGTLYAGGRTGLMVRTPEAATWRTLDREVVRSLSPLRGNEVAVAYRYYTEYRNPDTSFALKLIANVAAVATQTIRSFPALDETWVGTKMGVFRVGHHGWKHFPHTADGVGLNGADLYASPEVPATTVDDNGAIRQFSDGSWQVVSQLPPGEYGNITAGQGNTLWFVQPEIAVRWNRENYRIVETVATPADVYAILESRTGRLFGLCPERVLERRTTGWKETPAGPRMEVEAVTDAIVTADDDLFIATLTVLTHWELTADGGMREKFRVETEKNFRGLIEEPDGSILVGSNEEGIYRYRDGALALEIPFEKDPSARVRSLYRASDGRIWSGANEVGITSYKDGRWVWFGGDEGVPIGGTESICEDPEGHIWVAMDGVGLLRYVPSPLPPETMILQVPSQIPYRERSVFQFAGRDPWNFTRADDLAYSWRIVSADKRTEGVAWTPYDGEENIISPRLPYGDYLFEVRASDADFNVDPEPAQAAFTVLPPLWATTGFVVPVAILGVASLVTAMLLFRNYAALRVSEQYLREARDQAVAASQAKSQFLAHVSHEIRTPMNAILGHVQVMQLSGSRSPEDRENLDIIAKSGDHLLELINDVLEMAKIEAGRVALNPSTFDYREMVEQIVQMLGVQCDPERLTLRHETGPSVPEQIVSDQGKLRQILINLAGNAIKFTERGSIVIRTRAVPVAGFEDTVDLFIEIEDTGSGIDPESLKRIFEPFEQAAAGRNVGGAGLGLPISCRHIETMGGDIRVESTPGRGTTVHVRIPVMAGEQPQVRPAVETRPEAAFTNSGTRVLVVDDIDTNLKVMEKLLNRFGFSVKGVSNGADAIEVFSAWGPDVILMDSAMPGMDGKETTRRIRAMEGGERLPIIFVTGGAMDEEWDSILESGASAIIRKPFRHAVLLEKIAEHLGSA